MAENTPITYDRLKQALAAFGYQHRKDNSHDVFQHPEGKMVAVFPAMKGGENVRPVHITIADNTVRDDGIIDVEDYRFFLKHGKKRDDMIQKGDSLVWLGSGQEIPVVAASTEEDGMVIIKQKKGTFSPCPVGQLQKVPKANAPS